jgi:hypothetical protein
MSFQWEVEPGEAFGKLAQDYATRIHQQVLQIAYNYEGEIEQWMKANAPWADVTGEARRTLLTETFDQINSYVIIHLTYGVDYGLYLEFGRGGQYAVIGPAIDYFAPKIWADVEAMLRGG